MDKIQFKEHFEKSLSGLVEFTQSMVSNVLPSDLKFILLTNCSYDGNPLEGDEKVYPNDKVNEDSELNPCEFEEVIRNLWRDGYVPEWINVSIYRCDESHSFAKLECCGRFTAGEHLYHKKEGYPPFHTLSPPVPHDAFDDETEEIVRKFDINQSS